MEEQATNSQFRVWRGEDCCMPQYPLLPLKSFFFLWKSCSTLRFSEDQKMWTESMKVRQSLGDIKMFIGEVHQYTLFTLSCYFYNNDSPPFMKAHIVKFQPYYNLRNSLKLEIPPFKTSNRKFSISYRGSILWNPTLRIAFSILSIFHEFS